MLHAYDGGCGAYDAVRISLVISARWTELGLAAAEDALPGEEQERVDRTHDQESEGDGKR